MMRRLHNSAPRVNPRLIVFEPQEQFRASLSKMIKQSDGGELVAAAAWIEETNLTFHLFKNSESASLVSSSSDAASSARTGAITVRAVDLAELVDDVDLSLGDGVAIKREARRLDPAAGVPRPLQPLAGVEEDGNAAQKHSVDVSGGDDDDDDGDADGDAGGGGGAWVDINGGYGDEGEGEEEEDDDEAASSVVPSSSVAALSRVSLAPLD